jgi:hypothetical protein
MGIVLFFLPYVPALAARVGVPDWQPRDPAAMAAYQSHHRALRRVAA